MTKRKLKNLDQSRTEVSKEAKPGRSALKSPKATTSLSPEPYSSGVGVNYQLRGLVGGTPAREAFPFIDSRNNFTQSIKQTIGSTNLRKISETTLFDRAIERISNGVVSIPWVIQPPPDRKDDEVALSFCNALTSALRRPNDEETNLYSLLVKAIVRDLLVIGCSTVERQMGDPLQPFWLWPTDPSLIKLDPRWTAEFQDDLPRFWFCPDKMHQDTWKPIFNEEMFLIKSRASTYQIVPPSPVRLAYEDMNTWLSLHNYQNRTVSNATRDYMICLEDASEHEVDAFREHWRSNVVGLGEVPIIGGKVQVVKFGAKTDEELFLKYTDHLTMLLALHFHMSHRDFGLSQDDSYATASVSQSHSFQDAILPLAQCVIQNLDCQVIDYYYSGYSIKISDTEPTKEDEEATRSKNLFDSQITTRNEARRMVGEPPLLGGDKFKDGSSPSDKPDVSPPKLDASQKDNIPDANTKK